MTAHTPLPEDPSDFMTELMQAMNDFDERVAAMSLFELLQLSDDELRLALDSRICQDVNPLDVPGSVCALDEVRRSVFVVDSFDSEVQVYGLEFFLTGENRFMATLISDAFRRIGAVQHAGLFDRFCARHKLNPSDFADQISDTGDECCPDLASIPLTRFDEAYRELEKTAPVSELLIAYAKEHIIKF